MSNPSTTDNLPYYAEGTVVSGFGRGSKELGIPTANFPEEVVRALPDSFECGVYYGWAKISSQDVVYKMSLCVGWNPYYQNTVKTMETHIFHEFAEDFYGDHLKVIIVGYLRPMCGFDSLDALITAIHRDNKMASEHLDSPQFQKYQNDPFFSLQAELKSDASRNKLTRTDASCSNTSENNKTLSNGTVSSNSGESLTSEKNLMESEKYLQNCSKDVASSNQNHSNERICKL